MTDERGQEIRCVDCGREFSFGEEEQAFFRGKRYQPPRRCKDCRARRKAEREGGGNR